MILKYGDFVDKRFGFLDTKPKHTCSQPSAYWRCLRDDTLWRCSCGQVWQVHTFAMARLTKSWRPVSIEVWKEAGGIE